ncbi:MAG: phosphotransferase family protein [Sulfurovum sp.]|nr:phosphotransferase family protein [Sulfurovum sp.]
MIELLKAHPFFNDKQITSCELIAQQGYCNENYIVVVDGVKYVARKLLREDIDRDFEWKVLGLVYDEGITAEPLLHDEEGGFMVFLFLRGEHKRVLSAEDSTLLVDTLKRLHSITLDKKPIKLEIQNKTDEVLKAFDTIDKYPKEYVLCHNDLNPQNIFFTHESKLIDFEYAGVNDKYFDLACVCVEFRLDEKTQEAFLTSYFEDIDFSIEKFNAYKVIYKALYDEWFKMLD